MFLAYHIYCKKIFFSKLFSGMGLLAVSKYFPWDLINIEDKSRQDSATDYKAKYSSFF
jgi:hypothetical protein